MTNRSTVLDTQKRFLKLADEGGAALLITLMVMLLVFVLGSALATSMLTEITSSANYRSRGAALWQADAGLERVAADLLADPTWARDMVDFSSIPMVITNPLPMSSTINGMTVNYQDDGSGNPVAQYYSLGGTVTLDDGNFTRQIFMPPTSLVSANGPGTKAWLTIPIGARGASGVVEPSTANLASDLRVIVRRLTVWDNALFGGAGQAGNSINGNVQIRGSIHIAGDPVTDTNMGGTAFVLNHYRGASDNENFGMDAGKLPPVPIITHKGELVQSLGAEVRVKDGTINLSGNATWGEQDVSGNGYKEELDGFYHDADVNLSGSAAIDPSDTGAYDALGLDFPSLNDPYYDVATSTLYATHRDFLNTQAFTIPVSEISDDTPSFDFDDGAGNRARWNQASGTLTIEGLIRVAGDLDIATKREGVEYDGTGTIYAIGDIRIHGDLMPNTKYLDTGNPNVDNLGLIADDDMDLATGPGESWIKVMAALYAEGQTTIAKQTRIAGAVVSTYFDMGTNVPRIFQAANLSNNLPPGMPGSAPMLFVTGADVTNWYHSRQ